MMSNNALQLSLDVKRSLNSEGIEVEFKAERTNRPISIKASFGENDSSESRQYGKNEVVHWVFDKPLTSESQFTIDVRKHFRRSRRPKDIVRIPVRESDLVMKPFFEARSPDVDAILVRIHCGNGGPLLEVIRRIIEQSWDSLGTMKDFLEKFRKACEILHFVATITEAISSLNAAAKAAAVVAAKLLEFCRKLEECHASASELMDGISTFLPFTNIPIDGLKFEVTAQTAEEMLMLFERICRAIISYSNGSILGGFMDERIDEIRQFKDEFNKLKETFRWCLTTEVWKTTLKIEETTNALLLEKLKPLTEACYNESRLCFEGSRKDTIRAIEEWSNSESSPKLFWLHGSSGLGKTAIAHTVAKLFHEQNRLAGSFLPDERQHSGRIMSTVAYHLAAWHADYQKYVLDILRGPRKTDVFSGPGSQFELLMKRPMLEIGIRSPPRNAPLIIVLDSLESVCDADDCRRSILDYIVDVATLVPWLKVFISSRNCDNIGWHFRRLNVHRLALDDSELDLYHDVVAYARLLTDHRESLKRWTLGMRSNVRGLFKRISTSRGTINRTEALGPAIHARDADGWDAAKNFRELIHIVMGREGLLDGEIPVVRDILAVMSCVAPIRPVSEEALFHASRIIQPEATRDQFHALVTQLFPIVYASDEDTRSRTLRILFPSDIFLKFLSCKEKSGKFYVDVESFNRKILRRYLDMMYTGRASDSILGSKLAFEKLPVHAENAARIDSENGLRCIARSPDGTRIVSGKENGTLNVWDGWTGKMIGGPIGGHSDRINDVEFFPDGTKFVSGSWDMTVKVWDTQTCEIVWQRKSKSKVYAVGYSPDGRRVVSGHSDGRLRVWDFQKRVLIVEYICDSLVSSVTYSPDRRRIVSGSMDGTLRIWDAESGAAVGEPLKGHGGYVVAVAYSPDSIRIVSGTRDKTIRIWDARTGAPVGAPLKGHEDWVTDVVYSQDGSTIISASYDETVRFWNAADGALTSVLRWGESRWDPARSHFVSIPEWWPTSSWRCLTVQSLVYSSNPLYIPDDGWIRTLDGNLFLWVPPEHRFCSCHAASVSTMTTNLDDERLLARSAWKDLSEGRDWTRVIRVEDVDG